MKTNTLTPRENQVRTLLSRGHTVKEISASLQVSQAAIHTYCMHLREKGYAVGRLAKARRQDASDPLSPRQKEILALFADGKKAKEIAKLIGIKPQSVYNYACQGQRLLRLAAMKPTDWRNDPLMQ